jgi:DNA polymerase III epsilon subunit family exonuclease
MTPLELLNGLVGLGRVLLYGEPRACHLLSPRNLAIDAGLTTARFEELLKAARIEVWQVEHMVRGGAFGCIYTVNGRAGLYAPKDADNPARATTEGERAEMARLWAKATPGSLLHRVMSGAVAPPQVPSMGEVLPAIPARVREKGDDQTPELLMEPGARKAAWLEELVGEAARKWSLLERGDFVALDVETTGFDRKLNGRDRIIEIALVVYEGWEAVRVRKSLVNPEGVRIHAAVVKLTGITEAAVARKPTFAELAPAIEEQLRGQVVVAHNLPFDRDFIRNSLQRAGRQWSPRCELDTDRIARRLHPNLADKGAYKLDAVCERLGVHLTNHHRAEDDARACGAVWAALFRHINGSLA